MALSERTRDFRLQLDRLLAHLHDPLTLLDHYTPAQLDTITNHRTRSDFYRYKQALACLQIQLVAQDKIPAAVDRIAALIESEKPFVAYKASMTLLQLARVLPDQQPDSALPDEDDDDDDPDSQDAASAADDCAYESTPASSAPRAEAAAPESAIPASAAPCVADAAAVLGHSAPHLDAPIPAPPAPPAPAAPPAPPPTAPKADPPQPPIAPPPPPLRRGPSAPDPDLESRYAEQKAYSAFAAGNLYPRLYSLLLLLLIPALLAHPAAQPSAQPQAPSHLGPSPKDSLARTPLLALSSLPPQPSGIFPTTLSVILEPVAPVSLDAQPIASREGGSVMQVKLTTGKMLPIEMHKIRIVQKTRLPSVEERLVAIEAAGYNTFLLRTRDVFLDMLTDSGTNAMSDNQLAAMMVSDDAYAGGESYYKLLDACRDVLGFEFCLPTHQGRAAEHLLAKVFVKPGDQIPMNYHFTTTKAHFELAGGTVHEIYREGALETKSANPFKGNMDVAKFQALIEKHGAAKISFVRMECTTNLIGGQPFSMANLREVSELARKHQIPVVVDTSLVSENAYFIRRREAGYETKSIGEIIREMMSLADITYMSGRKSTCVRGGLIATNNRKMFEQIKAWLPVYEGFLTYGGMSSKEVEAMAVGMREMCDLEVASSSADLIEYFVNLMVEAGIPAVTPPGGLAGHVDAMKFLPHIPQTQYPAGCLAAAIYLVSGARPMERGSVSMDRDKAGNDVPSDIELARLAVPRRVYTMAHMEYVVDRLKWLHAHAKLVDGLKFIEEPPVLRFFFGRMAPLNDWGKKLAAAFKADFGAGC